MHATQGKVTGQRASVLSMMAVLFLIASSCALLHAQNIVPNADWELGPAMSSDPFVGWSSLGPDLWTPIATPDRMVNGSPAISRDGDPAKSGVAYSIFYGPTPEGGSCTLTTPLVSGAIYTLSCWLDVDDNFDNGPGAILFNFVGANSITTSYITNTGDWKYFDTVFVASGNSTELQVFGQGDNLMKLDDIYVGQSPTGLSGATTGPNTVKVFPNPFQERVHFRFPNPGREVCILRLFDLQGRMVHEQWGMVTDRLVLERGDLAPGSHVFRLEVGRLKQYSGRLTVH
ncbi:MAG: hypothetical protein KDB88_05030 [Flavobacteriales bacterium]|nr:hypothetical protein [Flavobacteriales bacterium]